MDITLLLWQAWWQSGALGFRERKPKRCKKKSSFWEPDMDVFDWEEFNKRNAR